MAETRVVVEQEFDAPCDVAARLITDPLSYPRWVEGIQSFEPCDDGTYLGIFGYLGYRKRVRMRAVDSATTRVVWRRIGGSSQMQLELSACRASDAHTKISFTWRHTGTGLIFGVSDTSPLFRAALEVGIERSLQRLAELAAEAEPEPAA